MWITEDQSKVLCIKMELQGVPILYSQLYEFLALSEVGGKEAVEYP